MRCFTDSLKRGWNVTIDVPTLKRVRTLAGVNLAEMLGERLAMQLVNDPILLVDVLFAVVKPQADAQKISDEMFVEGIRGDVLDSAVKALLEELADFFPQRRRETIHAGLAVIEAGMQAAHEMVTQPDFQDRMTAKIRSDLELKIFGS